MDEGVPGIWFILLGPLDLLQKVLFESPPLVGIRVVVAGGIHSNHHHHHPPTRVLKQRLCGRVFVTLPPAHFFLVLLFFLRYSPHVLLHTPACVYVCVCVCVCVSVCVCICISVRDTYVCLFAWVYVAGGMNPNELFYGPVDLLIVPQVLSLLTPNLLETTCRAWFFSASPLHFLLHFFLDSPPPPPRPSSLKVTMVVFLVALSNLRIHTLKLFLQCSCCSSGVVAVSSLWVCMHYAAFEIILSLRYIQLCSKVGVVYHS